MNHRERVLAAIHHQPIDRFPTDMWATQEVIDRLYRDLKVDNRIDLFDRLGIDGIFGIAPPYIGPEIKNVDSDYHVDEWGMGYRKTAYQTGVYDEQVYFPLWEAETISDLEKYPWPSPDWYNYSTLPAQAAQYPDRAVECGYTAVFYWHNRLRGLERSLMDPIERPEFTHYLVECLSNFFSEYHRRCFEAAKDLIDTTQVTDDFGMQTGLMISPKVFEEFYRRPIQRAIDLAHSYGLAVFHHDDGDMRRLLPRLTELGIQVLNPVQWRCGDWDLADLKAKYGQALCFHGGVDNQGTLPFGSAEDVRKEVRWLKETLGVDGTGLIIAPCHNLQAVTPTENIIAMYEEAQC